MTLYDELNEKYHGRKTTGKVLFRNDSPGSPSLHFNLSELRWEFSYGNDYGEPGIEGTFFYNDGYFDDKLPKDQQTKADFLVTQHREDRVLLAHISFYAPGSQTELIGEFLAQDSRNAGANSGLLNRILEGEWKFLSGGSLYDELNKKYNGRKTIGKLKWEFSYGNDYGEPGIEGTFFYNDGYFDDKLPRDQLTKADFRVTQHREDRVLLAHVSFYAPNSQTELIGEFLAQDSRNAGANSGLLNRILEGEWKFLSGGSLYDELNKKYNGRKTIGKVLFWNDSMPGSPSLHLNLSQLKWDFSYGSDYGEPGIEGTFFYNDGYFDDKLPKDQPIKADFLVIQQRENLVLFAHILFYAPNSRTELIGEFLAQDSRNASAQSGLLNRTLEGEWKFLSGGSLYDKLNEKYHGRRTAGKALFWNDSMPGSPSLHFNLSQLKWDFSYGSGYGEPGIEGALFYNDSYFGNKLPKDRQTKADFLVIQQRENLVLFAHILFYAPNSQTDLIGEFLAQDARNAGANSGLLNRRLEGEWNFLSE